jgi:ribosome biogenesis GTPase / thiamine phosphate phosphatase
MATDPLIELGWDETFTKAFAPHQARAVPGRIALEHQHIYRVYTANGEVLARVRGRLRHRADSREAFPAIGDWVALRISAHGEAVIEAVLPRKSRFSRKVAGDVTEEQVVAANIDTVFLVSGLDGDFNLRRLERYLATAWDGGARPVVILNKADLVDDPAEQVSQVEAIASGTPVHAVSARSGLGMHVFPLYIETGQTAAFLGSSGVGKSTLVNRLLGVERQRTLDVRASDDRGRHATTYRELLRLPGGGLLIDTPGMRELRLWEGSIEDAFADIEALSVHCHFRDCGHESEPRCAVRAAVEAGQLEAGRLESYLKLQSERTALEIRRNQLAQAAEKQRTKAIHRNLRRTQRLNPKG